MFSSYSAFKKYLHALWGRLTGYLASEPLNPCQVGILVAATVMLMTLLPVAASGSGSWAVEVNGRTVAVADDLGAVDRALNILALVPGAEYSRRVTVRRAAAADGPAVNGTVLLNRLARALGADASGTVVLVNGRPVLVVADRRTGELLLDKVKELYAQKPGLKVSIADQVSLKDGPVPAEDILALDGALAMVRRGGREIQTYVVRPGDTLWDVAAKTGVQVAALQSLNPGLTPENLQIGEKIRLSRPVPMINVVATRELAVRREIPFAVEKRKDGNLYSGQVKVLQPGQPGLAEVDYRITYRNGMETGRQEVSRTVLREPRDQVVAVGSWTLLASRSGTGGRLSWPVAGAIDSPFGSRRGSFHPGIDIAAGYGTPVSAAAPGRVVRAGWYGGYGNCVDIDHGNGVITRYGHLSSISVREGQQVAGGQLIGHVGSTGYSTGPHLHFEVRINDQPENPVPFL
ncbi:M23 family metallopeptidase [Desulfotomaculum copahuensis]|uniref:Peptidase M23 n=1 Tax=Desulfotomaculum copahuensis TaxID=1838280 RepID=A0A1B7LD94_9FIRM|nr:M23 family metallopeptidase [Desulfotomaculum copahuensis]OAT80844.1 hypothetical protein A6M21_12280 [Desulfotomaculum copahuensis]